MSLIVKTKASCKGFRDLLEGLPLLRTVALGDSTGQAGDAHFRPVGGGVHLGHSPCVSLNPIRASRRWASSRESQTQDSAGMPLETHECTYLRCV